MSDLQWLLDDSSDQLDIQEDNDQVTKVRQHFTVQIQTQMKCSDVPTRSDIGKRFSTIMYWMGGLSAKKDAPDGCKFICVADGFAPIEHPGDYGIRRQTWEVFGKFVNAPPEWNK